MTPETKRSILDFLEKCPIASLSTCSKAGEPESSAIYYHVDEEMNFYFMTKEFTHKSQNLIENPQVALLFYSQDELRTLQLKGEAKKLNSEEAKAPFDKLIEIISGQSKTWPPPIGKMEAGSVVLYKIEIHWARLGEFKNFSEHGFKQLLD